MTRSGPASQSAAVESLHTTAVHQALDMVFRVRVADPALCAYLDGILAGGPADPLEADVYTLLDDGVDLAGRFVLYLNDVHLVTVSTAALALAYLLWHINQEAIRRTDDLVLIHAAGLELDGAGVLLPAPMESGKTTLAAGLVRTGFRYLTDEAVPVEPATGQLRPYPKALSLERGSWDVLADLRPELAEEILPYLQAQWHVPPDAIRSGSISPPCQARFVIAPRYRKGADTTLEPIGRAEGLTVLLENTFNLDRHGASGFYALSALVRRCRCYRLTIGSLEEACRVVLSLVEQGER